MKNKKVEKRIRRHKKIRSKMFGTAEKPRVSVYKSNIGIFVQVIDDSAGNTILSLSTKKINGENKVEKSKNLGLKLAEMMKEKKIEKAVFDRGGNIYTGRVKAVAEGLREGGINI